MVSEAVAARREIEGDVKTAIESRLLPALGQAGRAISLTIPPLGLSSLVFLVDVEEGKPFVVRVARSSGGRDDLRRRVRTGRFWARHGLPTPNVLHVDFTRATRRATGFALLCETRIHGRNVVELAPGEQGFEAVGRAFAQVHSVERRWHHGSFQQPRVGPFGYRFVKRHAEWTRELVGMGVADAELTQAHRRWLDGFPTLHAGGPFQLIHRRCTESDVMLDDSGGAWVLEPQRCGFGSFLTDMVRIEERIGHGDEARIAQLHEGYFGAQTPMARARREAYDALAPAFWADLLLANALRWARKQQQGRDGAEARFTLEFDRFRKITGV